MERRRALLMSIAIGAVLALAAWLATNRLTSGQGGWQMTDDNTSVLIEPSPWRPWIVATLWIASAAVWLVTTRRFVRAARVSR